MTKRLTAKDDVLGALHVEQAHPDAHRVPRKADAWRSFARNFENWTRLNATLALASYFEVYFSSAVRVAIQSRPGILLGVSDAVEGVALLKRSIPINTVGAVTTVTKGAWGSRIASYRRLFNHVPNELVTAEKDLESLRKVRNGVGHGFGRRLREVVDATVDLVSPMETLSEERLKEWLGLVDGIVVAIDSHLGHTHIGNFETVVHYHRWQQSAVEATKCLPERIRAYREVLRGVHGRHPGNEFCEELIDYYEKS